MAITKRVHINRHRLRQDLPAATIQSYEARSTDTRRRNTVKYDNGARRCIKGLHNLALEAADAREARLRWVAEAAQALVERRLASRTVISLREVLADLP